MNNGCCIKKVDSVIITLSFSFEITCFQLIEVTCEHSIVFLFFKTYEIKVLSIEVTYNSFQITDRSIGFEKL